MESSATTPGVPGQDPSIIDVLERNVKAIVRIGAVLTKLSERLDVIEKRFGPMTTRLSPGAPREPARRLALLERRLRHARGYERPIRRRPQGSRGRQVRHAHPSGRRSTPLTAPTSALAMPLQEPRGRSRALARAS